MKHESWKKLLTEKAFRDCNGQDRTQLLMNPEAQVIPLQPFCFLHVFIYWRSEEDNTHGSDSLQKLGLSCYVGLRIESRSSGFWQAPLAVALPRWPPTLVVNTAHTLCDTQPQCTLPKTVLLSWDTVHYALQSFPGHTKLSIKPFNYRKYFK